MDGKHGPLEISDIVELVERNKYRPNIRWISGGASGPPIVTCLVGGWIVGPYERVGRGHETNYNVNTPFIPEHTVMKNERIVARGWRPLVKEMVHLRTIRPSAEVERLLGYKDFAEATRGLGCF